MLITRLIPLALLPLFAAALPACSAKKVYPDPTIGWHNANYSILFGRLQKVPAHNTEDPPVWTLRFGAGDDRYQGEFALTPPARLTGYSGGETVEVRGTPSPELAHPDYPGPWYEVQSIRMWAPHR